MQFETADRDAADEHAATAQPCCESIDAPALAAPLPSAGRLDAATASGTALVQSPELKTCPDCAEEVRFAARNCRFCGYVFKDATAGVEGFNDDLIGADGFVIPATQHDAMLWLSGSAYDVIFDMAREAITELEGLASVAE